MHIRTATEKDKPSWDGFVRNHPAASPYHLFAWKTAIEKSYGHRCPYLLAKENDRITGLLPLVSINPPVGDHTLVSLPFCDFGGVVAESPATAKKIIEHAVQLAREAKATRIELRHTAEEPLLQESGVPISVSSHKTGMLLQMPATSEELWKSFKSKLRSQVRKAEKNNLVFQWGTPERVNDFYTVFSRNMRDLGSPVHSAKWIASVLESFGDNARLGLVSIDGTIIGGGIVLTVNNRVCIPWASTLRLYNRLAPNMLLYWNFLKYAADEGYPFFDFGRSTPGEATYKFKAQWGAEPAPLYWYSLYVNGTPAAEKMERAGGSRSTAAAVWRRLPLPAANFLGPKIRKYISL